MSNKIQNTVQSALDSLFDYATPAEIAQYLEETTLAYINQPTQDGDTMASKERVNSALIFNARLTALIYALSPE